MERTSRSPKTAKGPGRSGTRSPAGREAPEATQAARTASAARPPSARLSAGRLVLDFDEYTPALIGMIYNRLSSGASQLYRSRFGVGIAEWRVIGLLAAQPDLPASRISQITGMDKAAVSRALAQLAAGGHVEFEAQERDERRKTWRLSEKGLDLNENILALALEREAVLMSGISGEEIAAFNALARRMLANLPLLDMSGADEGRQEQ